jgi:RNAse (barnase) inhibitor barstar
LIEKENLDRIIELLTNNISNLDLAFQLIVNIIDSLPVEESLTMIGRLKSLIERYTASMMEIMNKLESKDFKNKIKDYTS